MSRKNLVTACILVVVMVAIAVVLYRNHQSNDLRHAVDAMRSKGTILIPTHDSPITIEGSSVDLIPEVTVSSKNTPDNPVCDAEGDGTVYCETTDDNTTLWLDDVGGVLSQKVDLSQYGSWRIHISITGNAARKPDALVICPDNATIGGSSNGHCLLRLPGTHGEIYVQLHDGFNVASTPIASTTLHHLSFTDPTCALGTTCNNLLDIVIDASDKKGHRLPAGTPLACTTSAQGAPCGQIGMQLACGGTGADATVSGICALGFGKRNY